MPETNNIPNVGNPLENHPVAPTMMSGEGALSQSDLDTIFGTPSESPEVSGVPSSSSPELDEPADSQTPQDPEKLARTFQSNYDKTKAELDKIMKQINEEYDPAVKFLNQIYEDAEVRRAFIAELEPELVKPKDPYALVQEALVKEFGSEFVPDKEEADTPGSKSWFYNYRAQKLAEKFLEEGSKAPVNLKSLKEKRTRERQEAEQKAHLEKQEIVNQLKWDENMYNGFAEWASKTKLVDFARMYDRIARSNTKSSFNPPSLPGQSGGRPVMPNQFKQELDAFFGPSSG